MVARAAGDRGDASGNEIDAADEVRDEFRRGTMVEILGACLPARSLPWFITAMRSETAIASSWSCVT